MTYSSIKDVQSKAFVCASESMLNRGCCALTLSELLGQLSQRVMRVDLCLRIHLCIYPAHMVSLRLAAVAEILQGHHNHNSP